MWDFFIQGITSQVATFLTDRCTIMALQQSTDEFGGSSQVYTAVASDVPCRLIRGDKPTVRDLAFQEKSRETYRLIVGPATQIVTGQQIILGDVTYEVLGLRQALTDEVFHEALIGVLI